MGRNRIVILKFSELTIYPYFRQSIKLKHIMPFSHYKQLSIVLTYRIGRGSYPFFTHSLNNYKDAISLL